jgi:sulfopyruvate decarboxylase alpha subunit
LPQSLRDTIAARAAHKYKTEQLPWQKRTVSMDAARVEWSQQLYQELKKQNIRQVSIVPDAGHASLIKLCEADDEIKLVRLSTEEEGVALAVGAWLGGEKSVLLMQSSGVGNCINMLSMLSVCQVPLPMLITMRGDWAEFNPWQVPMGRATQSVLEEMGTLVNRADRVEDLQPLAEGTLRIAFNTLRPAALLIGQRLLGAKTFAK